MPAVHAENLCFSYSDAIPLIADASFRLEAGFTGLVGDNGAGKSTLLALISGAFAPGAGRVRCEPPDARVALCVQTVESRDDRIDAFARSADGAAYRLRGRFALDPDDLARWPTLSPGERKRWQIAAALAAEPDVLLLDEPTNHVDARTRALLVEGLRRFDGVGLVVSHDRALLDGLTRATLRVVRGRVELVHAPYSRARGAWDAAAAERVADYQERRDEARALSARLDRARRAHGAANRSRSSKVRMKSPKDHDARNALAKGRAAAAEKRHGRNVAVTRAAAARAVERVDEVAFEKTLGGSIFVDYTPSPSRRVLAFEGAVARGGRRILDDVRVAVERDSRVHVRGDNGAGKSLLLRALVDNAPPARVLYLPQELDVAGRRALADEVRALPPLERGRVLSVVAALGSDPARVLASHAPSPGEARKLAIAGGLGRHVWALVLDEPTNHLDLPSIERLETALAAYPGALVIATHDAAFAAACAREIWDVGDGAVARSASPPAFAG